MVLYSNHASNGVGWSVSALASLLNSVNFLKTVPYGGRLECLAPDKAAIL